MSGSLSSYESLVSYTVYETTHDGLVLSSQFLNRDDVNDYIDRFTSRSSYVHVYRTSCCDVLYPFNSTESGMVTPTPTPTQVPSTPSRPSRSSRRNKSNTTEISMDYEMLDDSRGTTPVFVTPFSEMTIRKYGKGYVMIPPENHELYGEKYINENRGWWNNNAQGWFFKKNVLQSFLDLGAVKEI